MGDTTANTNSVDATDAAVMQALKANTRLQHKLEMPPLIKTLTSILFDIWKPEKQLTLA